LGVDEKDNVPEVLDKYIRKKTLIQSSTMDVVKALISERMLIEMPVKIEIKPGEKKEIQKLVNIFVRKFSENKLDVDGEDIVLEGQCKDIKVLTQEEEKTRSIINHGCCQHQLVERPFIRIEI
jgi:hypothetical protein